MSWYNTWRKLPLLKQDAWDYFYIVSDTYVGLVERCRLICYVNYAEYFYMSCRDVIKYAQICKKKFKRRGMQLFPYPLKFHLDWKGAEFTIIDVVV
jgi:hypothetical protein